MNREIKFRAWDKEYKTMCQVDLIRPDVGCHLIGLPAPEEQKWLGGERGDYTIIPAGQRFREFEYIELMQYTGLSDKQGKEIYEGDVVKHPLCVKEPHDIHESCETFVGQIQFEVNRGQYFAVNMQRNGYVIAMTEAHKFEIIGNIYSNSELLNQVLGEK